MVALRSSGLDSESAGLLHISFRGSKVLQPLDDVLPSVPGAFARWSGDRRRATLERLPLHRHVNLDVLARPFTSKLTFKFDTRSAGDGTPQDAHLTINIRPYTDPSFPDLYFGEVGLTVNSVTLEHNQRLSHGLQNIRMPLRETLVPGENTIELEMGFCPLIVGIRTIELECRYAPAD